MPSSPSSPLMVHSRRTFIWPPPSSLAQNILLSFDFSHTLTPRKQALLSSHFSFSYSFCVACLSALFIPIFHLLSIYRHTVHCHPLRDTSLIPVPLTGTYPSSTASKSPCSAPGAKSIL